LLKLSSLTSKWRGLGGRERFLAIVFICLLLVYASYMFYFKPQLERLDSLRQELNQALSRQQTALAEGWDDIPGLKRQIVETEQRMEQLQAEVPAFKNTPGLLVDLYRLASKYDLYLNGEEGQKITFSRLEKNGDYSSYDVSLELVGRSADIYGFLYEVQRLGRLLAIDKGVIWTETKGQLKCALTIKVFVLGEVKEDPKTYPFMTFERFLEEPYVMFQPSVKFPAESPGDSLPLVQQNTTSAPTIPNSINSMPASPDSEFDQVNP